MTNVVPVVASPRSESRTTLEGSSVLSLNSTLGCMYPTLSRPLGTRRMWSKSLRHQWTSWEARSMSLPHGEISCECQKDPEEIYSFFFNTGMLNHAIPHTTGRYIPNDITCGPYIHTYTHAHNLRSREQAPWMTSSLTHSFGYL